MDSNTSPAVEVQPQNTANLGQAAVLPGDPIQVDLAQVLCDDSNGTPAPRILKVIKKLEVQVLCTQHNPAVAAAKKASKQDKIRNELFALPSMTRIKIRVSAGVFEVSLVRVIEESKSVEVLWDRGVKREFKWGSVVFGQTDEQNIQQKPSEPAPEPERKSEPLIFVLDNLNVYGL
ncbi:hypothetical protein SERLADRAFT_350081 [Serpula lacrymans var. lacrymans S7.9]|uniref:Uncharacterized protein n=1 Tax=Serpula lacrymans var. lacrymans (strain S7.9) TaxID=578457 RepID=F8P1R5_SERL9|nr:uncharacterized protein SERLADRAFT_350081 [Serpula lacrymans var. lacrymans S7.9]EGO23094.1 hypothetical protein SERLADRAFT_350081 [Serpula lacrymans var. lacrymans S7.9]